MAIRSYRDMVSREQSGDRYWIESAKLDFAFGLNGLLKAKEIAQSDLAEKLGVSQAYVSKALRGDANLTIGSMVRFARAADAVVHIDVRPQEHAWSTKTFAVNRPITSLRLTFEVDSSGPLAGRFVHTERQHEFRTNDAANHEDEPAAA